MIKKIIIKVFKLKDISDMLVKAKKRQKLLDDRYWQEVLDEQIAILTRENALETQEKDSTIAMLETHLAEYKKRDKEISNKEFLAKKQIKENYFVVQNVVNKMQEFNLSVNGIYGEMLGIKDIVEIQRKKLEKSK